MFLRVWIVFAANPQFMKIILLFQPGGTNQVQYTRTGSGAGEDQRSRSSVPEPAVSAQHDPAGVRHDPQAPYGST